MQTVETCYDRHRDVLFASVRPEPLTLSDPVAVDLFLLRDAATDDVVGFECLDFSRHAQDDAWLRTLPETHWFLGASQPERGATLGEVIRVLWREVLDKGLRSFGEDDAPDKTGANARELPLEPLAIGEK